jgi:hypothetical protein
MRNIKAILTAAAAVLGLACNTDFARERDGSDTGTDTGTDAELDVPADVEPDGEPPQFECHPVNDVHVTFPGGPSGTHIVSGCTDLNNCRNAGLWVEMLMGRLLVVYASEEIITAAADVRFMAEMRELGGLERVGLTEIHSVHGVGYDISLQSAAKARGDGEEVFLVYPTKEWDTSGVSKQNLEVLLLGSDDGIAVESGENRLFNPDLSDEVGWVMWPRAVTCPGTNRTQVFYHLAGDETGGPPPTEIRGRDLAPGEIAYSSYDPIEGWYPVVGDMTEIFFAGVPGCRDGVVALPWLHMDLDPALAQSGVITIDLETGGYDDPQMTEVIGTGTYTASLELAMRGEGRASLAVLSSDSAMTMVGMNPPYEVDVATFEPSMPEPIETRAVATINEPFLRDPEFYDIADPKLLNDPAHDLVLFLHPFYPTTGDTDAHVIVWPLHPDGVPAGEPFEYDTDIYSPPAFDATIDPGTGHVYFAYMHETDNPDGVGRVNGFSIVEMVCEQP